MRVRRLAVALAACCLQVRPAAADESIIRSRIEVEVRQPVAQSLEENSTFIDHRLA